MTEPSDSVEADTAIGKFKISGSNVNNLLTILIALAVSLLLYIDWSHAGDSKESAKLVAETLKSSNEEVAKALRETNKDMSKVLQELAAAMRERTCLDSFPTPEKKAEMAETCKRVSR